MEILRIPKERIRELLGKNGENKEKIEKNYNVKISIEDEGEVLIKGNGADTYFAKDVVHAIGRGFRISEAVKLFKDDYLFHVIELRDQLSSENAMTRVKGRVIGDEGKIKKEIEDSTDSTICVYGHTVSIIAPDYSMEFAKEAIYKILEGAPHTTVLNYLAKIRERLLAIKLKG